MELALSLPEPVVEPVFELEPLVEPLPPVELLAVFEDVLDLVEPPACLLAVPLLALRLRVVVDLRVPLLAVPDLLAAVLFLALPEPVEALRLLVLARLFVPLVADFAELLRFLAVLFALVGAALSAFAVASSVADSALDAALLAFALAVLAA